MALQEMLGRADGVMPIQELQLARHIPIPELNLARLDIAHAVEHFGQFELWIQNNHIVQMNALEPDVFNFVAEVLWSAAANLCVLGPASITVMVLQAATRHGSPDCPADAPRGIHKPLCRDCGGETKWLCRKGPWKGCECFPVFTPTFYPDKKECWEEREHVLQKALRTQKHEDPDIHCNAKKIDVFTESFKQFVHLVPHMLDDIADNCTQCDT